MFRWIVLALVIAMISAIFGFSGVVAPVVAAAGKIVFFVALGLAAIGFLAGPS